MSHLLVVLPSWLGDTVMAEPALRAIRRAEPGLEITALGRPGLAEVLSGTGLLDRDIVHAMRGPLGPLSAARAVRRSVPVQALREGAILLLPNSARSAVAARLVPARRRMGYATDMRSPLLSDAVAPPPRDTPFPAVDWYALLAERTFGIAVDDRRPRLRPTPGQVAAAAPIVAELGGPFAVLVPGANRQDKRWPAEHFTAVGKALVERGLRVAASGSGAEKELVRSVAVGCGGLDLSSRGLGLGTLLALFCKARLVVSNDTGPRHLALGLDVPTVSLFGPTDPRWTTIPRVREVRLLGEPFLTEGEIADRRPKVCRVERIAVGDVMTAIERLLEGPERSEPAP